MLTQLASYCRCRNELFFEKGKHTKSIKPHFLAVDSNDNAL